jgi:hypothetical protein
MSDFQKLVSVFVVLLVPAVSVLALGACPQGMHNMGDPQSQMEMQMQMAGMALPDLIFGASGNNLCCEVDPAETVPGPPTRSSVNCGTHHQLGAFTTNAAVSQAARTVTTSDNIPKASSPPQAFLCVFLI